MTLTSNSIIKCIVWDLDNTIWDGVLSEDQDVFLREEIPHVLSALDKKGVLHSIASQNDYDVAWKKLVELGIDEYFLHPKIYYGPKSKSILEIVENLNINLNTILFVDDQEYERREVKFSLPEVCVLDATEISSLLRKNAILPKVVSSEATFRRKRYKDELIRKKVENEFRGTNSEFLVSLHMELTIRPAKTTDLSRIEELIIRTNQLNATGTEYSHSQLLEFIKNDRYELLVAELQDQIGDYGIIGLSLVENFQTDIHIRMLLMSCRVLARGLGGILINDIIHKGLASKKSISADYINTGKNRNMLITLKLLGFQEFLASNEKVATMVWSKKGEPPVIPEYLSIQSNYVF